MSKQEVTDVYVPKAGEAVLIEWAAPGISDAVGDVVRVEHAELHPNGGCIMLTGLGTRAEERRCRYRDAFCRVRPASAIDVECPLATRGECDGVVGHACCGGVNSVARPPHMERQASFLSLTGQAPKDSRSGHDVEQRPEPGRPPAIVGSERGDSGTGRAAAPDLPLGAGKAAAPSGFRAPTDVYDVDCEACEARGARSHTADRTAAFCREDGRRVEPHALRVAAFEARRERPEPTKIMGDWPLEKCRIEKCDQEARHAGYCADCAGEIDPRDDFRALQRGRARGILRTDLDRPLPPAALRTWPEHWETPGWES